MKHGFDSRTDYRKPCKSLTCRAFLFMGVVLGVVLNEKAPSGVLLDGAFCVLVSEYLFPSRLILLSQSRVFVFGFFQISF